MSTYIDALHPERHAPYLDVPDDVVDYLHYLDFVKQRSARTINGYYLDLRGFFRYMLVVWQPALSGAPLEQLDLPAIQTKQIASITKRDIFNYLDSMKSSGNGTKARSRKLSTLHGFFKYMVTQADKLKTDPSQNVSMGTPRRALPKYLTRDESVELLKNIQSDFYERDFCILTLFLNCGMRLSELISINLVDFRDDTIRIIGKGDKERLVYLNDACKDALEHYLPARAALPNLLDRQALLVSKKTGKRLTARRVEQIVARCLQLAGLGGMGYSPHKLRHTAATLMYQYGDVDMLALKEILGHENVSTTQIYTHINQRQLRDAVASSPLSTLRYEPPQEADAACKHSAPARSTKQKAGKGLANRLDAKPDIDESEQNGGEKEGGTSPKPAKKYRKK